MGKQRLVSVVVQVLFDQAAVRCGHTQVVGLERMRGISSTS